MKNKKEFTIYIKNSRYISKIYLSSLAKIYYGDYFRYSNYSKDYIISGIRLYKLIRYK